MSAKLPISVVVLSYNDQDLIRAALESMVGWIDEIFVLDSGSTDRTVEIAKEFTSNIFTHPFLNYAAQRNWAQENLPFTYGWVFHVDADERATPELRIALELFFCSQQVDQIDGLMVARRTVFMGRWIRHGGHYPVYHLRIFRRDRGYCEDKLYDQHFVVEGNVLKVHGDLIDTITTSLDAWTLRHVRWATMEAQQKLESQSTVPHREETRASLSGSPIERRRWLRTNLYDRQPLFWRAVAYFVYRYFFRLGFLDGTQGLIFHVLQGFWFRFYTDAKLWEAFHLRQETPINHKTH